MAQLVVSTAQLTCSFGAAPGSLTAIPKGTPVQVGGQPLATVADHASTANIAPFGMCSSLANPQVAAATSAAMGTLTPQPCIPATTAPWSPGSTKVTVGGQPALTATSTCACNWGGVVTVTNPGQTSVDAT